MRTTATVATAFPCSSVVELLSLLLLLPMLAILTTPAPAWNGGDPGSPHHHFASASFVPVVPVATAPRAKRHGAAVPSLAPAPAAAQRRRCRCCAVFGHDGEIDFDPDRTSGNHCRDDERQRQQQHRREAGDSVDNDSGINPLSRRTLLKASSSAVAGSLLWHYMTSKASAASSSGDEKQRIAVFEKASPSVVFIDTFTERRDVFSTDVFEVPLGSGSGIVWDKQGHIVTNYHVVRNSQAAQVAILTPNGRSKGLPQTSQQQSSTSNLAVMPPATSMRPTGTGGILGTTTSGTRSVFKATVVGVDPTKDVAVLKVDAPKNLLYPIDVGTSSGLKVGMSTLAIGNPFGLDHTLTSGIISGTGRQVKSPIGRPINNVIQTDAGTYSVHKAGSVACLEDSKVESLF